MSHELTPSLRTQNLSPDRLRLAGEVQSFRLMTPQYLGSRIYPQQFFAPQ